VRSRQVCLIVIAIIGLAGASSAAEVFYARSNGSLESGEKPGRYGALNILDDNHATAWCSAGTGEGSRIVIVFSEKVDIDRMDVFTGNQASKKTYAAFSRVREMQLRESEMTHSVRLADKNGSQSLSFDPAISTRRLTLELQAGFRGKSKRHSCISDIIFYSGRRALNGKKLKPFIANSTAFIDFLDTWISGPEYGKNRELVLGIKKTYTFAYVPSDPMEQAVNLKGDFRIKNGALELKVKKSWIPVKVRRDDIGKALKIKIEEGNEVPRGMSGVFTRFRDKKID
jgi:hypothetical protein